MGGLQGAAAQCLDDYLLARGVKDVDIGKEKSESGIGVRGFEPPTT